jgi:exodeoxyribonuclease VII large subunit
MEITEQRVYSVSELTKAIKGELEEQFSSIWVEGEVSNLATPQSGHTNFQIYGKPSEVSIREWDANTRAGRGFGL